MNVQGKVVVVTGASGGVGRALVRLLARNGARVGMLARGKDGLDAAQREVEELGSRAVACIADVSRYDEVESAARQIEQQLGPIDVWVNNAMVSMYSPFMKMEPDEFKHIVEVTFLGQMHGTKVALSRMIPRNRGVIVQVGSALAYRSIPLQSAYCASKHAVVGFTESVRSELIHNNVDVRISMVHLPGVNTPQFTWTKNKMPRQVRPTGPIYEPELAAEAIKLAIEKDRRQVFLGYPTLEAVIGEKFIPGLLDKYLAHAAWEGALLPAPADPNAPDNFWQALPGDFGARGRFTDQAIDSSAQLWMVKHRNKLLAAAGAAVLGLAGWLFSRGSNGHRSAPAADKQPRNATGTGSRTRAVRC